MGKIFTKTAYPLLLPAHPSGTVVTPYKGRIVDASGNGWYLTADGHVAKNGSNTSTGSPSPFAAMLWLNGQIYCQNQSGTWYQQTATAPWTVLSGDPRTASIMPFWGANGHETWNQPAYAQSNWDNNAAALRDLGLMSYRNGYSANYNTSTGAITSSDGNTFLSWMSKYPDITLIPVLLPQWNKGYDGQSAGTETTAYTMGYNLGVDAATKLGGKAPYFECGNEFENGKVSNAGNSKTDFDNTMFLQARGSVRGMIAGIKSVNANYKIAIAPISWLHFGLWDMFADGSTPAAPTTYDSSKIITWDYTPLHVYTQNSTSSDDFENLVGQPISNGITRAAAFGKPIIISEFGVNTSKNVSGTWTPLYPNEAAISAALTSSGYLFDKWYSIRNKYSQPIIGVQVYQLSDSAADGSNVNEADFGLTTSDGVTRKARYTAVKNFIAAHPV